MVFVEIRTVGIGFQLFGILFERADQLQAGIVQRLARGDIPAVHQTPEPGWILDGNFEVIAAVGMHRNVSHHRLEALQTQGGADQVGCTLQVAARILVVVYP